MICYDKGEQTLQDGVLGRSEGHLILAKNADKRGRIDFGPNFYW